MLPIVSVPVVVVGAILVVVVESIKSKWIYTLVKAKLNLKVVKL